MAFRPDAALIGLESDLICRHVSAGIACYTSRSDEGTANGVACAGEEVDCHSFALHVRGGDAAVGAVAVILRRLNLRAIDSQTGEFFVAGEGATESFQRWKRYRDQVITRPNPI